MPESIIIGWVGLGMVAMINVVAVAFSYGALRQNVRDICRRLERLERWAYGDSGPGHPGGKKE